MASVNKALVPVVPNLFRKILSYFPEQYFKYCFAYGSGVFNQGTASGLNPMIDMVFVVDDSVGFHGQNLLMNPSHYSFLKSFGHNLVANIQEKWPARVYYNTLIPMKEEGVMLKYGVIKRLDLINDLFDWDYLYLAGRLHKPVLEIEWAPLGELKMSLRQNLYSALHAALIVLPQYFTERQLYETITGLSYNGDFRMIVGENKYKVNNIVNNQVDHFRNLYRPLLVNLNDYVEIPEDGPVDQTCMQDLSSITRMYHLFQLPKVPQQALAKYWRKNGGRKSKDTEDVLRDLSTNPDVGIMLTECLKSIVFQSSYQQSIKGIFTAGFGKSLTYSNKKISKMIKSN